MASILFKWLLWLHPFFVSVAEINHNAKDKTLELSIHIFTTDLENALRKNFTTKVDLTDVAMQKDMQILVNAYIITYFKLFVDDKSVKLKFDGFEQIEESTWCYFEVNDVSSMKKIQIKNSLLYDYETKQTNMNIVKYNGVEKTKKLEYPEKDVEFGF